MVHRLLAALLALAGAGAASGEGEVGSRQSSAAAPAGSALVAAVGDIACAPSDSAFNRGQGQGLRCRQADTARLLDRSGLQAVLTLGDNQYEQGSLEAFRKSYHPSWGRYRSLTRPALGNHEYATGSARGYFDYFNGRAQRRGRAGARSRGYYSFSLAGWRIYALNSNCSQVGCARGSDQHRWLTRRLSQDDSRCVLAYWHHPRFSSGSHGDQPQVQALWRSLARARAELVLAGHDHSYERLAKLDGSGRPHPRGIRSFVAGAGGKSLYSITRARPHSVKRHDRAFGVLFLRLQPGRYSWRYENTNRRVLDSGNGRCS